MLYVYLISVKLSYLSLALILVRLFMNMKRINIDNSKDKLKLLITLLIVCIVPILNIFFAISSAYVSLLMKKDSFLKLMNQ
ncbi:hypothetical protein D2A34_15470 [Clostridium chromiireducens]|uniref:Uncharacterized protein n=1 Tax=Clostridium chromiireducens TaxID=225345 RepID=A0A399IPK9_9CLOT|nr:hypothetical protein [Clostridium chromiireducens]MVX66097.1 hypothetical protein [Clostridium chromiireducens]RII34537.1 hypothetical protein D2A34_15470 [Clostridium chromiireducens]